MITGATEISTLFREIANKLDQQDSSLTEKELEIIGNFYREFTSTEEIEEATDEDIMKLLALGFFVSMISKRDELCIDDTD